MTHPKLLTRSWAMSACAALIACSQPPATTGSNNGATAPPAIDTTAQAPSAPEQTLPNTLPAPSAAHPRFVGLWAVTAAQCSDAPWRFEAAHVATKGEVSCTFQSVQQTQTGYDINARCIAEAPAQTYRIQVSFAESARAMMLSGGPWNDVALVYCGPLDRP
jgi:hypothetical protein